MLHNHQTMSLWKQKKSADVGTYRASLERREGGRGPTGFMFKARARYGEPGEISLAQREIHCEQLVAIANSE